jgi:ATP-dependent DNA ligase
MAALQGHGRAFHEKACAASLEGIVSKRADAPYTPGSRGLWFKVKCLHREEFVVVGWTDDNLLRQVVYEGLREDKPAAEVP